MTATKLILGMRDTFFNDLFTIFKEDESCIFITADNGDDATARPRTNSVERGRRSDPSQTPSET